MSREEESRDLLDELSVWKSLISHAGWKRLQNLAAGQIRVRELEITRKPLKDMDAVLAQEFMKGELQAFLVMSALPGNEVDRLEGMLNEVENQDEPETLDVDGGSGSGAERRELLDPDSDAFGGDGPGT